MESLSTDQRFFSFLLFSSSTLLSFVLLFLHYTSSFSLCFFPSVHFFPCCWLAMKLSVLHRVCLKHLVSRPLVGGTSSYWKGNIRQEHKSACCDSHPGHWQGHFPYMHFPPYALTAHSNLHVGIHIPCTGTDQRLFLFNCSLYTFFSIRLSFSIPLSLPLALT